MSAASFTDEDRATLDRFAKSDVGSSRVGKATARALAYIDHLEGEIPQWRAAREADADHLYRLHEQLAEQRRALEAADDLARAVGVWKQELFDDHAEYLEAVEVVESADAYQSTRGADRVKNKGAT